MDIDLNADLGEGYGPWRMGEDEALLELVSSANVACGFHAGDPAIMNSFFSAAGYSKYPVRTSVNAALAADPVASANTSRIEADDVEPLPQSQGED